MENSAAIVAGGLRLSHALGAPVSWGHKKGRLKMSRPFCVLLGKGNLGIQPS
jgi:hypothetical protein